MQGDKSPEVGQGQLLLADKEQQVLQLHDRLRALELEVYILRSLQEHGQDNPSYGDAQDSNDEALKKAQRSLLEARSQYFLRNHVVDSLIMTKPVREAIHGGCHALSIERSLLSLLEDRDETSFVATKLSAEKRQKLDEAANAEVKSARLVQENIELAAEVLRLAKKTDGQDTEAAELHDENSEMRQEFELLDRELKASRQKWKVMKGTASAVVVGSGVDWVNEAHLWDLVLDVD